MPPLNPRLDKHGFPIPAGFETPGPSTPRRRIPPKAALLIVLAVGGFLAFIGSYRWWRPEFDRAVAAYYERRGLERQALDDLSGALADLNRAAEWSTDLPSIFYWRSQLLLEQGQLDDALADCDRALRANPFPQAYSLRSQIHQRLGDHDTAIEDATTYVELAASGDPNPLNTRAYVRAIAGKELEEALDDVERALALDEANSAYLDTRGYVLYLLGRYREAQADLERAVAIAEREKALILEEARLRNLAPSAQRRVERSLDEGLSVLYHHRGLVREKLGRQAEAQVDFQVAEQLGYNPAKGVL